MASSVVQVDPIWKALGEERVNYKASPAFHAFTGADNTGQFGVNISSIPELRWHLFCKNMAENGYHHPLVLLGSISCGYIFKHMCGVKRLFLSKNSSIHCKMATTKTPVANSHY